ncbi:MAG: AraC family transcriptional regulator [Spongiibacteraceae bacterium]
MTTLRSDSTDKITSRWPLPAAGVRFLTPQFLLDTLSKHPLSHDLFPLAMGFYPKASGHRMQRSSHATYLLIYCTGGSGELVLENKPVVVKPGDLLILPPGIAHNYAASTSDPWSIFWVHYQGDLSAAFTEFLQLEQPLFSIGIQPHLIAEFETLLALRKDGVTVTHFIRGACRLKALLTEFACATVHSAGSRSIDMDQLLQHMQRHLGSELDLDALAATANLSKFHFIRRFRERTGHTPIQHFIHMKMQHACQLLDGSDEPIKRIASAVGYSDPLYFSRLFKRVMGVSPQHYREHHTI